MLNIENIDEKYYKVVNSKAWKEFQEKFNKCNNIFVLGHGGNLAVADHAAVDISRLSNGTKNALEEWLIGERLKAKLEIIYNGVDFSA